MIRISYKSSHELVLLPLLDQRESQKGPYPYSCTTTGLGRCVTRESEITTSSLTIISLLLHHDHPGLGRARDLIVHRT